MKFSCIITVFDQTSVQSPLTQCEHSSPTTWRRSIRRGTSQFHARTPVQGQSTHQLSLYAHSLPCSSWGMWNVKCTSAIINLKCLSSRSSVSSLLLSADGSTQRTLQRCSKLYFIILHTFIGYQQDGAVNCDDSLHLLPCFKYPVISQNLKVDCLAFGGDCFTLLVHMSVLCKREAWCTVTSAFLCTFCNASPWWWPYWPTGVVRVCKNVKVVEFDGILCWLIERPLILLYWVSAPGFWAYSKWNSF